jgi:hypothetical protein
VLGDVGQRGLERLEERGFVCVELAWDISMLSRAAGGAVYRLLSRLRVRSCCPRSSSRQPARRPGRFRSSMPATSWHCGGRWWSLSILFTLLVPHFHRFYISSVKRRPAMRIGRCCAMAYAHGACSTVSLEPARAIVQLRGRGLNIVASPCVATKIAIPRAPRHASNVWSRGEAVSAEHMGPRRGELDHDEWGLV